MALVPLQVEALVAEAEQIPPVRVDLHDRQRKRFARQLGFDLLEDTYQPQQDKRWVLVAPPRSNGASLLLARATTPEQERSIGNQTGGRVFLFLSTDDFWRDYRGMKQKGITFVRDPQEHDYGTVAVFEDLYGNLWDLIEPRSRSDEDV